MSPRYIDASSIVPMLSLSERQKAWARIIQFVFTDTLLSALNDQNMITEHEYDRLLYMLEQRCGMPEKSIFLVPDYKDS